MTPDVQSVDSIYIDDMAQREWLIDALNMIYTMHAMDGRQVQIFFSDEVNWGYIQQRRNS